MMTHRNSAQNLFLGKFETDVIFVKAMVVEMETMAVWTGSSSKQDVAFYFYQTAEYIVKMVWRQGCFLREGVLEKEISFRR